jgi:transcriptional regulator with XRE-family HTH domain
MGKIDSSKLHKILESRNISQLELARACGISSRSLNYYVKREKNPSFAVAIKICKILKISLRELAIALDMDVIGVPPDPYDPWEDPPS